MGGPESKREPGRVGSGRQPARDTTDAANRRRKGTVLV